MPHRTSLAVDAETSLPRTLIFVAFMVASAGDARVREREAPMRRASKYDGVAGLMNSMNL